MGMVALLLSAARVSDAGPVRGPQDARLQTPADPDRAHDARMRYVPGEVIVKLRGSSSHMKTALPGTGHQAVLLRLKTRYGLADPPRTRKDNRPRDLDRPHRLKAARDVRTVCAELSSDPDVEYVQPNYCYHPFAVPKDPLFADQYAHHLAQMPEAWDITTGSPQVVVAVIGTGVDVNHPDLRDNIWVNEDEVPGNRMDDDDNGFVDDVQGWDFDESDGDVYPTGSYYYADHETMVAGIIAASGDNGIGSCGVTWRCRIMALRLSDEYTSDEVAAAIRYAAANGARVINMSFGADEFGPEGDPVVKEAVDYASGQGVLLVASAGNADTDRPNYPAAYPHVLAVAATSGEDMRARWGDGSDGSTFGLWVDLSAPGTEMTTCELHALYTTVDGTSFSSPYVAGVAALLLSERPDLTAMEVRAILENTTDPIEYGSMDPNLGYLGTGRVNGYRALRGVMNRYPLGEIVGPRPREEFSAETPEIPVVLFVLGDSYRLECRAFGQGAWTSVHEAPADWQIPSDGLVRLSLANPGIGSYVLRLSVTRGAQVHTDQKAFGVPVGPERRDWPHALSGSALLYTEFYSSPVCLDVNTDGRPDVIQSVVWTSIDYEYGNATHLWNPDGDSLMGWPRSLDEYSYPLTSVAGDIDGDADLEVVTVTDWGSVHAWHAESGQPVSGRWPRAVGDWNVLIESSPVLADLDGDGDSEILVAAQGSKVLVALQGDGTEMWSRLYEVSGPFSAADLDRDGDVEIALCGFAAATSNVYTYILDHQGQMLTRWRGGSEMGTAIADLDADGVPEVLFCTDDSVKAVHPDGTTLWTAQVPGDFGASGTLVAGDLDGDALAEVFVAALIDDDSFEYTGLFGFDSAGRLLAEAGFPKTILGYPVRCEPLIGDVDGDGVNDLLLGAGGAALMAWNADGSLVTGFPRLGVCASNYVTPVLADLDRDGRTEVLLGGDDYRFHVVDLPGAYASDAVAWGQFRHDPQGSGWASRPPRLEPASMPTEVRPGQILQVQLAASNPDHLAVRFCVGQMPEGAWFDRQTNTLVWKPTADQVLQTYTFHILVTDGVRQDSQAFPVTVVPDAIYYASLDTDPGWSLDEGWAWGRPAGQGSWKGDPNRGHTGPSVVGTNLDGDYTSSMGQTRYATTGAVDCTGYTDIRLGFWRWLGVESPYDKANLQVSNDGLVWVDLWVSGQSRVSDSAWQFVEYPVPSSVADGQATVFFRWGLGPTDDSITYPGWNIDDVQVTGERQE